MPYFTIKLPNPVWCNHCKINIYEPLARAGKLYCSICRIELFVTSSNLSVIVKAE